MKILVTGAAGFIGSAVCRALSDRGDVVVGLDNLSDYYDVDLKRARLEHLAEQVAMGKGSFSFEKIDLANNIEVELLFNRHHFDAVAHLAAQPGVRYSLENPQAYMESNIVGFTNILDGCRLNKVNNFVFASSSSVYGANESLPFGVNQNVDHPVSLYAASKKSNELMAHSYAHLFGMACTGLRFFTVYGPWGRPDMALSRFTKAILAGEPINLFNYGKHTRDLTYIDDIVEGVVRVMDKPAEPDPKWSGKDPQPGTSNAPWRIYNIGSNNPVSLKHYVEILEHALGTKAKVNLLPLQPGDVQDTFADIDCLISEFGYRPNTSLEVGVTKFVEWYRDYYAV